MLSPDSFLLMAMAFAALVVAISSYFLIKDELTRILQGGQLALLPTEEVTCLFCVFGLTVAVAVFEMRDYFPADVTAFKLYLDVVAAMLLGLFLGGGSSAVAELRGHRGRMQKQGLLPKRPNQNAMTIFNTVIVSLIMSTLPALFVGVAVFAVCSWLAGLIFSSATAVTVAAIPGCVAFLLTFCQLLLWWLRSAGLSE